MQTTQSPARPGVVITGPQGSGKTVHAEALCAHFGLARILDDESWCPGDPIPADTLVLTHLPDERARSFESAMAEATVLTREPYCDVVRHWTRDLQALDTVTPARHSLLDAWLTAPVTTAGAKEIAAVALQQSLVQYEHDRRLQKLRRSAAARQAARRQKMRRIARAGRAMP